MLLRKHNQLFKAADKTGSRTIVVENAESSNHGFGRKTRHRSNGCLPVPKPSGSKIQAMDSGWSKIL